MYRSFNAAILAASALFAIPAAAQDEAGDSVNMVIVYGDDACPPSTGGEIVVCARQSESERFRIPEALRLSDDPANAAWAKRVESLEAIGDFGTLSCSPTGAGGFTGCTQKLIDAAYGEKRTDSSVRFGEIIAAARADRLSTIDEDAAEQQRRVEELENAYLRRLEAERDAELPDAVVDPSPPPIVGTDNSLPNAEPSKPGPFDDGDEEQRAVGDNAPAVSAGID
ncbi:hypothetical protein HME9302_02323 [Alteripontixanthobacter maritimus]|uniref:Uncharacterized protein n=1 Tax=Alteripontixanthobacter maritimus TaxID=2161824 RepID=A0A369Q8R1_9SPHN|nr:nucleolar 14 family protein [Alteripontixanthobacter maritimus]RDC61104.1 hypothetical protein HME9302_02323 [Alteripontixanthobacter maritimus]